MELERERYKRTKHMDKKSPSTWTYLGDPVCIGLKNPGV